MVGVINCSDFLESFLVLTSFLEDDMADSSLEGDVVAPPLEEDRAVPTLEEDVVATLLNINLEDNDAAVVTTFSVLGPAFSFFVSETFKASLSSFESRLSVKDGELWQLSFAFKISRCFFVEEDVTLCSIFCKM